MAGQLIRRGKRRLLAPMFVVGTLAISGCEDPTPFSPRRPTDARRTLARRRGRCATIASVTIV